MSIHHIVWQLETFADSPAVLTPDGTITTYAQLARLAGEIAANIPARSLVFCLCRNALPSLAGYVATLTHDIVPLMLDAALPQERLAELARTFCPDFLWLPEELAASHASPLGCEPAGYSLMGYSLVRVTTNKATPPLHPNLGLLVTTSGSTGSPRLVRQTRANIKANADSIANYLRLGADERPITTLPMHYVYGMSVINSHLAVGACLLLTDETIMQRAFWDFAAQARATSLSGVPYTYEMLDRLLFCRRNLPDLRTLTQAGGKLNPDLQEKFAQFAQKTGKQFFVMYGASEATSRMGYLPPELALAKKGAIGKAIPGGAFSLVDELGQAITQADAVGELVYAGPNVAMGYAESRADLARGDDWRGVLHTGDMAKRDADGIYYIVGRKKRFLKIFGNRISLDAVDTLLRGRFPELECASTGRDNLLVVALAMGTALTPEQTEIRAEAIRSFLAKQTRLNPAAFRIVQLPALPRNAAGKIRYQELATLCAV